MSFLDATAVLEVRNLIQKLKSDQIQFLICDVIGPVRDILSKTGLKEEIGEGHVFLDLNEAVLYATEQKPADYSEFTLQAQESK